MRCPSGTRTPPWAYAREPVAGRVHSQAPSTVEPCTSSTIGRDVETQVLARAVEWHNERHGPANGNSTVVFR